MIELFCYACNHQFLLFVPAIFFFTLPIIRAIFVQAQKRAATKEKEARQRAKAEQKLAAEEARRQSESTTASHVAEAGIEGKPKRGPGRPRKSPPPDPNAPKRPRGRPRKNPAQVNAAKTVRPAAPAKIEKPADTLHVSPVMLPEEFINSISA